MQKRLSPLEKEWIKLQKQEQIYMQKRMEKKDSRLNQLLEKKVPQNLQKTLDTAFSKAFYLIFEKGTGVIEKTYKKEELEKTYKINEFAAQIRNNRKSLKAFSKKASGAGNLNMLISGVSGIGLGVLGIGIPDIVLFTGLMLKSVYEIALNFGFDYEKEEEKPETTDPPKQTTEEPTQPKETEPEPEFDINYWVEYAKNYAVSKGLVLSSAAVDCWDNPIGAGAHCIYLERDIQSRLNRYANDEDITDVWIWAEPTGNGRYDLYIGYA